MTARKPATPIATLTRPRRKARPWVSVTTTPTRPPTAAAIGACRRRAEASGSVGSSTTEPSATFEESMPALAQTKPWWVSQITVPPRRRTIRRLSERISSQSAGVLPVSSASARAAGPGRTSASTTRRPSALLTTFWATIRTSPGTTPSAPARAASIPARSSPGRTSGRADSGQSLRGRSRPRACRRSPGARRPPASRPSRRAPSGPPGRVGCRCRGPGRGARRAPTARPRRAAWARWRASESRPSRGVRAPGGRSSMALVPVPRTEGTNTAPGPGGAAASTASRSSGRASGRSAVSTSAPSAPAPATSSSPRTTAAFIPRGGRGRAPPGRRRSARPSRAPAGRR